MPSAEYSRKQAQVCARLALISRDPILVARYNAMALEHLARAADGGAGEMSVHAVLDGDGGSDMDRD
jgi:hypothetical protein